MTDFHKLYIRYADDVYRFALYLCGNAHEAEEIAAETFARALTGRAVLKQSTVKGYLLTIARNLYVESLRRRKRLSTMPPELADIAPGADEQLGHKRELEALQIYLQTIPEADRAALLLRGDGLSYTEIAAALNISVASAKVKVHRLRLKLAQWRGEREENEGT